MHAFMRQEAANCPGFDPYATQTRLTWNSEERQSSLCNTLQQNFKELCSEISVKNAKLRTHLELFTGALEENFLFPVE